MQHEPRTLPRPDLREMVIGRCGYAPVLDHRGCLINDPVVLHVGEHHWWFSVSDSDVVLWAGGSRWAWASTSSCAHR